MLAGFVVGLNLAILSLLGLATLTPPGRLKVCVRKRGTGEVSMFSDEGLPWPWVALSAVVAFVLLVWGLLAWRNALPFEPGTLATAAVAPGND